jgi:tetratricopeptide (TPR) repeat protein/predicted AlkP superfamily phosphohydrolase/phosphomutase
VLLVGVDGADPDILDRLIGGGRLPTFARLKREGAFGRLRSREPLLSPIVWTSIATGRKGQDHGVLDFVETTADGTVVPITSTRRRVPALWNVLTQYRKRSGFIGWYGTYPAEEVTGFIVSDRLGFHQVKSARARHDGTFPARLEGELRGRLGDLVPDVARTRTRFVDDPGATLSDDGARRLAQLAEIHATTEFYRQAAPGLQAEYRPDLLAVYFELVDACGHLFMEDAAPRRPGIAEGDFRAFAGTVDHCYEYQDEVLADLLRLAGPDTLTLVVSDHGFKSGHTRPETSGRADTGLAPLWHKLHGVVLAQGAGIAPGTAIKSAGVLDVAPTVLARLGVPLSKELPGVPIPELFGTKFLAGLPDRVERYAAAVHATGLAAADDDSDRVERLRALGYVSSAKGAVAHDDAGRTAASYLNEGSARSADGDSAGALLAFTTAVTLDPRNVNARVFAARIHTYEGDFSTARTLLDQALALDPRSVAVRMQRATLAIELRDWAAAAADLAAATAIDDRLPNLHLLKARLADATGQAPVALDELRKAQSLTDAEPLLAEILGLEARIALGLGRTEDAEKALARAESLAPGGSLAGARGDLALARGEARAAVDAFREALGSRPQDAALERKLGQALSASGDTAGAEAAFRRSLEKAKNDEEKESGYGELSVLFQRRGGEVEAREILKTGLDRLPNSAALWGMMGAAWGRAGDLERATSAYERSVALHPTPLACKTLAALVFEVRKDKARAIALWKQALDLDPRQDDVREFLRRHAPPGAARTR